LKFRAFVLSVACVLSLTACGGGGDSASASQETPTKTVVSNSTTITAAGSGKPSSTITVPAITTLQVVEPFNANKMTPVMTLKDGMNLVLADLPQTLNIEAVSADPAKTGSVTFLLEGPRRIHRTENKAIYTLADAFANIGLANNGLPEGSYVLWVTPYSGANGSGSPGETVSLTFTVSAIQPAPAPTEPLAPAEPSVPNVASVQLLEYVSTGKGLPVKPLTDGDTLILADLPNVVNIEAVSEDAANTGSVEFVLQGPRSISRVENTAIYTLADEFYNLDLAAGGLPEGNYTLQITPYAEANKSGAAGQTFSMSFSVNATHETVEIVEPVETVAPADPAVVPGIASFQIIEYTATNTFAPVRTLNDGDTLVLSELPNLINIEAVSEDVAQTGSVDFVLEGPVTLARSENTAIYTLADAFYNFDLAANALPEGQYTLSVTPYTGANKTGDVGQTVSINFTVQAIAANIPDISYVQLLEYVSSNQYTPLRTLTSGETLVLDQLPSVINIEAVSADPLGTGSVAFALEGPHSINRVENAAIYTMADAYYNLDLTANALPEGDYTLRVTPYTGLNQTGSAGRTFETRFSVAASAPVVAESPTQETILEPAPEPTPEPAPAPTTSVPPVTGTQILGKSTTGSLSLVRSLAHGDTIDLAQMPNVINIEAVSADPANTGSVAFELSGPTSLKRVENHAIYTAADALYNFNLSEGALPAGNYILRVTPYSGSNATGDAGATYQADFSVTGQPTPAPVANNDSYEGTANTTLTVDAASGVLGNDTAGVIATAEAYLAVQPSNGTLTLNLDGGFVYTPDYGFSGIDNFDYVLVDEDEKGGESTATVTLSIADPVLTDTSAGFTPIVASSDTRTVYVSSSEGLDTNNGLTIQAPVKTLNRAFSLVRAGYPDHVLLKRGDVWVDENLSGAKSGRSDAEPAVIAFYGESGGRPKLKTSGSSLSSSKLYHVNIMGLEIIAYKKNPADPAFDGSTSANIRMVGDFNDILFEDMKLRFVEFVIQGWNGGIPRNIQIRRSMILDKYSPGTSYTKNSRPSGIYTDYGEGLTVEDNLWDHNGWNAEVVGAGANMYNHNMYISEKGNIGNKIVVRNNIITRGSALGVHGRPGGLYENNFFGRNPIGLQMGYFLGPELAAGTIAYARNNVITEGLNMNRGIDACSDPNICTKAIWGLQVENLGQADVRVEGNIVSNRLFNHEGYVKGIRENAQAKYSNNIVYRWDTVDQGTTAGYPDPTRTLADYNASLGGERSFEAFIEAARSRGLQQWDTRYTAEAINNYIRAGFGR
jgi:hypothetical protein